MKNNFTRLLTLSFVLLYQFATAQTDLQNTGILYVSGPTDILYINGAFTNASGAALTNNGNLHVKQNLINGQAAMAVGTGTLLLNGSAAQAVNGTQVFKTFNLVSNNASGITLNNDLSVSGVHTFTAGVIISSATPNYLMFEAGSSYTGDGDTKHVNGWVRKTGSTNFIFPLGNGTVERTIGASSLSASSVFNANYAGATTNTGNVAAPLVVVDPYEYWTVNQVSGGSARIDMNWDNSKITMANFVVSDIRVANYITGNWTQVGGSATGTIPTTGTITSNLISSFGSFVLGSITSILPLKLIEFNAKRSNAGVLVNWTTSDEVNVNRYDVERSENGIAFYNVGSIAARNQKGLQQYEFTDNKSFNGRIYYRLRSIDGDGKTSVSKVVMVSEATSIDKYFTATNITRGNLTIVAGSSHNGDYIYRINTFGGQTIQQGRLNIVHGGSYNIPLTSTVAGGIYILEVQNGQFHYQQKIILK